MPPWLKQSPRNVLWLLHITMRIYWQHLAFFRNALGFTNKEIQKVIKHKPLTLGLTNETLQEKIDFIQNDIFDGDFDSTRTAMFRCPSAFGCQIENMQTVVDFLLELANGNKTRVQAAILYSPAVLGLPSLTLEHNGGILLQKWFQGNNTAFQDFALRRPDQLLYGKERVKRRIDQVLQLGLDYSSHGNLDFLSKPEAKYGKWLGNRQ
mmetsp:Transcript_10782/g.29776  ORF Transcript_10782/g.29776 Transcript_10782/m.29776 type:complete len:208 (+) Transcript_10782:915-1538(+)